MDRNAIALTGLLLATVLMAGCVVSIPGKGNATHHLIIGVGVVTVNEPKEQAVLATDTQALGLSLSDRPGLKLGLGYSSSTVVTVADGAEDVRVEISKTPGGPLVVDTQSAILEQLEAIKGGTHGQDPP